MSRLRFGSNLPAATLLALLFTSVASAVSRTYVSRTGSDSNPCTEAAPCRTFAQAYSFTTLGGQIHCLDAGEYGNGSTLNITTAITIDCSGTSGSRFAAVRLKIRPIERLTGKKPHNALSLLLDIHTIRS